MQVLHTPLAGALSLIRGTAERGPEKVERGRRWVTDGTPEKGRRYSTFTHTERVWPHLSICCAYALLHPWIFAIQALVTLHFLFYLNCMCIAYAQAERGPKLNLKFGPR